MDCDPEPRAAPAQITPADEELARHVSIEESRHKLADIEKDRPL